MTSIVKGRLFARTCGLFVVDVQERFRTNISSFDAVVATSIRMARAAQLFDFPVTIFGEQYPKGLGKVVKEIDTSMGTVVEKMSFSLYNDDAKKVMAEKLKDKEPLKSIILCGIEAHVCVLQTTMDLVEAGYEVHVLTDGVSSMNSYDRFYAFERMKQMDNVFLTTSQSVLFQLLKDARHPQFKEISNLVKAALPDPGMNWTK